MYVVYFYFSVYLLIGNKYDLATDLIHVMSSEFEAQWSYNCRSYIYHTQAIFFFFFFTILVYTAEVPQTSQENDLTEWTKRTKGINPHNYLHIHCRWCSHKPKAYLDERVVNLILHFCPGKYKLPSLKSLWILISCEDWETSWGPFHLNFSVILLFVCSQIL